MAAYAARIVMSGGDGQPDHRRRIRPFRKASISPQASILPGDQRAMAGEMVNHDDRSFSFAVDWIADLRLTLGQRRSSTILTCGRRLALIGARPLISRVKRLGVEPAARSAFPYKGAGNDDVAPSTLCCASPTFADTLIINQRLRRDSRAAASTDESAVRWAVLGLPAATVPLFADSTCTQLIPGDRTRRIMEFGMGAFADAPTQFSPKA